MPAGKCWHAVLRAHICSRFFAWLTRSMLFLVISRVHMRSRQVLVTKNHCGLAHTSPTIVRMSPEAILCLRATSL
jgi:hypothetical protein